MTAFLAWAVAMGLVACLSLTHELWWRGGSIAEESPAAGQAGELSRRTAPVQGQRQLDPTRRMDAGISRNAAPSARLAGVLALFVSAVGTVGYWQIGSPAGLELGPETAELARKAVDDPGGDDERNRSARAQQINSLVERLAARLKDEPANAEGWSMLARSYLVLGRHEQAVEAYRRAEKLRPNDAALLADFADALAVIDGHGLQGEPRRLIDRALKADPAQPKALALAGAAAFSQRRYTEALEWWEQLARVVPADDPYAQQVQRGITEARQLAQRDMAAALAAPEPRTHGQAQAQMQAAQPAVVGASSVSGTVVLAKALAGKAQGDDTVFVFARAAEGPRTPLALQRVRVRDLPLSFTLDDSMAMSQAASLSSARKVVVGARVSKSGNAIAQAGDLQGLSNPVAVGQRGVIVEIREVVVP